MLLAGVISGGDPRCRPGGHAFNSSVFRNREWIASALRADRRKPASFWPAEVTGLRCERCNYCGFGGARTAAVPAGTRRLQASISCSPSLSGRAPRLDVVAPDGTAQCKTQGDGLFQTCSVDAPAAGNWQVNIMAGNEQGCSVSVLAVR